MRIKYCFIFLFFFSFCTAIAQENPRITLFPWMHPYYNPGAMGENELNLNFTGIFRQQSMGMQVPQQETNNTDGTGTNPPTKTTYDKVNGEQIYLNVDSYIKKIKGAIGISFLKDKNGYYDNIDFKLGYAARLPVYGGKLGIGVQLGFLNQKLPADKLHPHDNPDPLITNMTESYLDFDINFGLHYKAPTWYVGVSGTQLIGGVRVSGGKDVSSLARRIYISGGYIWNLKTAVPWSIEPSILIGSNFATWSMDVMAVARYNGIIWFGLTYQLQQGIAVLLGAVPFYYSTNTYLRGLELGLSYTFATSKFSYKSSGGWGDFEILIRYGFNFFREKPLTGYGSSRHLYKNQY